MKFSEFLRLSIVSPAKAFRSGVGKFLIASIMVGMLANPGNFFLGVGKIDNLAASFIVGLIASLAFFLIVSAIYHGMSRVLFQTQASYTQFLSIYGFAHLPMVFTSLAVMAVAALNLIRFRSPTDPTYFSFSDPWLVGLVVFGYLMSIAHLLYTGLALDTVYSLGWKRVVPIMLLSMFLVRVVVGPLGTPLLQTAKVSLGAVPLNLTGVRYIDAPNGTITIPYKAPQWIRGEQLVARIGPASVRGPKFSAVSLQSDLLLVDLLALPSEIVSIRDGEVWVNHSVAFSPQVPLTQLNLEERILAVNEVLVYVRSPEALGTLMSAEQFIISLSDVLGSPRQVVIGLFGLVSR